MPQEAILEKYPWGINSIKLARAVQALESEVKNNLRKEYSDEDVKAKYVSYGGALLEETAQELETRAKYMAHAGPIQRVIAEGARKLKERISKKKAK